jgi:hypothetical protein
MGLRACLAQHPLNPPPQASCFRRCYTEKGFYRYHCTLRVLRHAEPLNGFNSRCDGVGACIIIKNCIPVLSKGTGTIVVGRRRRRRLLLPPASEQASGRSLAARRELALQHRFKDSQFSSGIALFRKWYPGHGLEIQSVSEPSCGTQDGLLLGANHEMGPRDCGACRH